MSKNNSNPLFYYIAFILAFTILALLSCCMCFDAEDLYHMQAHSMQEGLYYAVSSYNVWNSRIGELLLYVMAPFHGCGSYYLQFFYYVLNPIACVGAVLLAIRLGVGQWYFGRNTVVFLFAFLCLVGSKQNWLWFDGNLSWLYPCVIAMIFFVLWESIFRGKFQVETWKFFLSVPLAVIVGMSNENTSVVSLLLFLGSGVYASIRQRRICLSLQYAVVAGLLLAATLMFYMAPGRAIRAASAEWELSFHNILFNSLLCLTNWIYSGLFYWREAVVYVLMLFIGWRRGVKLLDRRMGCLLIVLGLLWCVLLAAPCWGAPRAYTPLDFVLFAIMVRMFHKIVSHEGVHARDGSIIMAARVLLTMTVLVPTIVLAHAQYQVRCQIAEHADAALARGETRLVLRMEDFDTSPVMPRYFHIPGCVVSHDLQPFVPLIGVSKKRYEATSDFSHRAVFPYGGKGFVSCGDDVLNRGVAKRFGLDEIVFIVD